MLIFSKNVLTFIIFCKLSYVWGFGIGSLFYGVRLLNVPFLGSSVQPRCASLLNADLHFVCNGTNSKNVRSRYARELVLPEGDYNVFLVNNKTDFYMVSYGGPPAMGQCKTLTMLTAKHFLCDESPLTFQLATLKCLSVRHRFIDDILNHCSSGRRAGNSSILHYTGKKVFLATNGVAGRIYYNDMLITLAMIILLIVLFVAIALKISELAKR